METTSTIPEEEIKLDFEPATPICRGCLTTGRKATSVVIFKDLVKELTDIDVSESDGLPQWLCYECSALLIKSVRFKRKMLMAHNTLYQYLMRCAPFGIDAHDEELSKYASPHLSETCILFCDITGKGKNGTCKVLEHEKQVSSTILDDIKPMIAKMESEAMMDDIGFSDYEDNITLEEFKSSANKITEDDIETLLRETDQIEAITTETTKKRKTKKKDAKIKKTKMSEVRVEEVLPVTKSTIRKPIELDPKKIRVVTLNPEEQIKQREAESRAGLKFPFQCNLCHKGFNFESKLENHMSKHSPSRGSFECKLCKMFLPTSYSFSVHNLIHTRRFECVECERRMIDRSSIIDHYRTQHEGLLAVFTCHICGKVSNNNKTHRGHMRNHHSGDRPKCDECGKTFVNKDSLIEHLQIHQGIKNYECQICGSRFRTRTQIKHHQLKHTDVKEFYCVECDVRFKSAHSLRQHLLRSLKHKDSGSLIYACNSCDKRYETAEALLAHEKVQHEGVRSHVCTLCGAALASRSSLIKHQHTVHAGRRAPPRHVCHTCGKTFRGKSVLTNHVRTHTGEKPFECTTCGRTFSQRTAMRTHVKLVHLKLRRNQKVKPELIVETGAPPPPPPPAPAPMLGAPAPKIEVFKLEPHLEPWRQPCDVYFQAESRAGLKFPFQCNLCHKGFNFESKLENHMSKHSPSRGSFECKLCKMFLPTSYSFSVHNLIHTRRFECVECERRMIDRSSIIDHYRTQHEGLLAVFTCHICGKVSNNNKTHRGHMRNHHSGDRPKCDECGKTFVNKDSLIEHLQIHQGIKNYECQICGSRFRTRTQIKHHQLKHTDVKEFYCVECDVRFKSAHSLRQHLLKSLKHKDSGSLICACNSCDKRYETAEALLAHEKVQHEGVRSHVCTLCGAALASRSSLIKHQHTVHAGRRAPPRHVCHTCGKTFRGKSVLTNHVRTHTGEKPFECTTCGRTFSQRTAMRTHVKLVHLKLRRNQKVKPELIVETGAPPPPPPPAPAPMLGAPAPKIEVFKLEPHLEPWRQPCDVYFQVTAGP